MSTDQTDLIAQRDASIEALRRALRNAIHDSDVTQREIELRNGYGKGYLSQVLKGHITLTLRHTMGILLALEIRPWSFFMNALGDARAEESRQIDEIREQMTKYDAVIDELRHALGPNSADHNSVDHSSADHSSADAVDSEDRPSAVINSKNNQEE